MDVLISGASVAGPTLAYWLHHYGFRVTVVEKAAAVRSGGYPIDVRGTALDVLDRMGALPAVRAGHIDTRRITFVGGDDGRRIATLSNEQVAGGVEGRDLEVPRGHLTGVLYGLVRDEVDFRFGDSIATLVDDGDRVRVTFASGEQGEYDLVVGADGVHSNTRRLAMGPEGPFVRHLGRVFTGFTLPNDLGLAHEVISWTAPDRIAVLYAPGCTRTLHGFLSAGATGVPGDIPAYLRETFAGDGWRVPQMIEAMTADRDRYSDTVSQIHLPSWSKGRVALIGDAAHAPSFLSGQGTSTALVTAYVLAAELATRPVPEALTTYQKIAGPYVRLNQALADGGARTLAPPTASALRKRNAMLRMAPLMARVGLLNRRSEKAYTAMALTSR